MNNTWEYKPMPKVVKWGSGGTPKADVEEYYENGTIPWLVIGDLTDSYVDKVQTKITKKGLENSSAKIVPSDTLLIAMYGSIGKLGITRMECCTNQAIAFAKELYGVTTKYMYYYLMFIRPLLVQKGKGGTQKNISQTVINSLIVPVPSLPEQERIVARIEELFADLDKSVAALKRAKEQVEEYSQSLLKGVFENLEKVAFGTIMDCRLGKMLDKKKNTGIPHVYLRNINVRWLDFDLSDLLRMPFEQTEKERYSVRKGDLLICEGGEPGRCAVWENEDVIFFQKAIHRVRFTKRCLPKLYAYYFLYAYKAGILNQYYTGMGIEHLTGESLVKVLVPNISYEHQKILLNIIDDKMSVIKNCENVACEIMRQADLLRQSILKKAFEGEL